jgi:hypothetical protein
MPRERAGGAAGLLRCRDAIIPQDVQEWEIERRGYCSTDVLLIASCSDAL